VPTGALGASHALAGMEVVEVRNIREAVNGCLSAPHTAW